jgi:hypothetical protein
MTESPPVQLEHRSPRNEHQVGRHLGRPREPAVGWLVVVISGDVINGAVKPRHSSSGRAQVVTMKAEIADLNRHLHIGRKPRNRSGKMVEFAMHVADERDHG